MHRYIYIYIYGVNLYQVNPGTHQLIKQSKVPIEPDAGKSDATSQYHHKGQQVLRRDAGLGGCELVAPALACGTRHGTASDAIWA